MNNYSRVSSPSDPTILYICAAARSGSTLCDMFLGGHSQMASSGELNFLGKALRLGQQCTCGSTVASCESWGKVLDGLRSELGFDLRSSPYALRLWDAIAANVIDHAYQTPMFLRSVRLKKAWMEFRQRLPNKVRRLVPVPSSLSHALENKIVLYRAISRAWGKQVLVDSSKNQREAVELFRRWPERVRVVLLTRDGCGVFLSQKRGGRENGRSLSGWRNYYRRAVPLIEKEIPDNSLFRLRYEDLAQDPEKIGRELCSFAGVTFEPAMLDLSQASRHMVNGNDTRFAPRKGIQLDERWRHELSNDDLEYFDRHGGSLMNRRLGYE